MESVDLTPWPTTVIATLTNYGYALYTLNLLKSLKDIPVLVCCLDSRAAALFRERGYHTVDLGTDMDAFCAWNKGAYDRICYMKMRTQYAIIQRGKNVLMIDGDIVFLKDLRAELEAWEASTEEVVVQNDAQVDGDHKNLCAGFMFVRATDHMRELFDTETEEGQARYRRCAFDNNDQMYFNDYIKPNASVKPLPLRAYPNGKMFMEVMGGVADPETMMVHYNWLLGHEKIARMKQYRMWLLTEEEEHGI